MKQAAFPDNTDPRYFTLEGYRAILSRALELKYRVSSFRDFQSPSNMPVLLLRHDLDRPLEGTELFGRLEAELGATSTYFVQTACDFYNLLSKDSRKLIRELADLGHEIGLHYDAERYLGEDGRRTLVADLRLIEDLSGQTVISASQHIPIDGAQISLDEYLENEAYEPRFTQGAMTYISDSLMVWRQATPHELLEAGASFQFLTHPDVWLGDYRNMGEAMKAMMEHECEAIRARYAETTAYYAKLLSERDERDKQFQQRSQAAAKTLGGGAVRHAG